MRAVSVALLASASVLLGCADRAETGRAGEDAQLLTVSVLARPHLSMAPLLIALEEGYFLDEGLDVELVSLGSSSDGLPSLVRGDLDVIAGSIVPAYFNLAAGGAGVRFVAGKGSFDRGADGCSYIGFWTRRDGVLPDGRLAPPAERRKWLFSVERGSHYEFLLERLLAQEGMSADAIELHHLDSASEASGLTHGTVDLAMSNQSRFFELERHGLVREWRSASDVYPGGQFAVLAFGPTLTTRDREAGRRFVRAYVRGVRQYNEGKTERNLEILAARTDYDREEIEQLCWIPILDDGAIDEPSVAAMIDWADQRGYLDQPLALDQLWDPSFLEAAWRDLGPTARAEPGVSTSP